MQPPPFFYVKNNYLMEAADQVDTHVLSHWVSVSVILLPSLVLSGCKKHIAFW